MKNNLTFSPFTGNAFKLATLPEKKSASPAIQQFLTGNDMSDGRGATMHSPYSQSASVYTAISCLAENVAQIPLRISLVPASAQRQLERGAKAGFKKKVLGENIIESGAVVDLFNHPHPTMDRALFWAHIVSWKALRGEFFVTPLDRYDEPVDLAGRNGKVAKMLALDPAMFWHVVQGYDLTAWRYTGSPLMSPLPSEMLVPTEVIHHRTFNPFLFWRGMSPMVVAGLAAMTDYAAAQFMKGLMMNNADTGVIITTDQQVEQTEREQIMAALRERKRAAGTADRPLFLWGGAKMEKPAISNADMEFLANRKYSREEIFSIFKVPPSMAGIETASGGKAGGASGSSSGGSQQQDRRVFIENTVSNYCRQLEAAFGPLVKRFDPALELWFDVDSQPIMQEARRDRLDAAGKAFGMGIPLNDITQTYDLGFPEYSWGDTSYLPFNLQSVGNDGATEPPEVGNDANNPTDPEQAFLRTLKSATGIRKLLTAPAHVCNAPNGFEESIAGSVRIKRGKIAKFFFEQRSRLLAKLETNKSLLTSAATKDLNDLWNSANEDGKLIEKLKPLLLDDLEFGGNQLWQEIDLANFKLAPADAIKFLAQREPVIKDINQTTWERVRSSLEQGLKDGESYDQMAARIKEVYNTTDARADVIALTETNVAINSGRNNAMVRAGITRKGWLTSHLENTRLTHTLNEQVSQEKNGIPIGEVWPNGCSYPGDPLGAPGETINCRCVGYAVKGQKHFQPAKFLSYDEFQTQKGGAQ